MIRRVPAVLAVTVLTIAIASTGTAPPAHGAPSDPVSVADVVDLVGFNGTISPSSGPNACNYEPLKFDGSYPGSSAVGTIDLSVAGCLNFYTSYYSGSFTITTSEGMLTGSASGAESESTIGTPPSVYDEFPLDLTATAGTGPFAGMTGSVQALFYAPTNLTAFQGTVDDTFTQVLYPQGGVVRGVTYLDAGAYETSGVSITGVVFELNGHIIATATPTLYGWLAAWNTTLADQLDLRTRERRDRQQRQDLDQLPRNHPGGQSAAHHDDSHPVERGYPFGHFGSPRRHGLFS